jgi:hypothetical protein
MVLMSFGTIFSSTKRSTWIAAVSAHSMKGTSPSRNRMIAAISRTISMARQITSTARMADMTTFRTTSRFIVRACQIAESNAVASAASCIRSR